MILKFFSIFILIWQLNSIFTNTTDFWKQALKSSEINYQSYSGYEEINWYYPQKKSGMFYNMFSAHGHNPIQPDSHIPLILWLQGGPGASSQFGAFVQNGPIMIANNSVKQNRYSWNIIGHMVFIDQPLGTGFSYLENKSPRISTSRQAADHLLNFLYNFYQQWPALKQSPLFIAGQSFAGHIIPAFASKIKLNATFLNELKIDFEGVMIGDGWTDPIKQLNHYDSFLYSIGVASKTLRERCTWFQTQCIHNIMLGNQLNSSSFLNFLVDDNDTDTKIKYFAGMSVYNFRNYDEKADNYFQIFLNANKLSFGVPEQVIFDGTNDTVYQDFAAEQSRSYAGDVAFLLKNNIKILIYNGQYDFIVNTPGVLNYLNSLNWQGISAWKRTRKQIWTIHRQVKGWAKVYNNLWFVFVNKAGHMVPADQPESAFNMLGHFIFDDRDWKQ